MLACEEGVTALRNVLVAFSRSNSFVGYCQSMNFIAGFLLTFATEEDAFWLLTKLINDIIPHYFSPNLLGVRVCHCAALGVVRLCWSLLACLQCPSGAFITPLNCEMKPQ